MTERSDPHNGRERLSHVGVERTWRRVQGEGRLPEDWRGFVQRNFELTSDQSAALDATSEEDAELVQRGLREAHSADGTVALHMPDEGEIEGARLEISRPDDGKEIIIVRCDCLVASGFKCVWFPEIG
jgi:hypothetical protein